METTDLRGETLIPTPALFDFPFDDEEEKRALTTALRIVQGFALYFVVSDSLCEQRLLMDEVEARIPYKDIQHLHISTGTTNIIDHLLKNLEELLPDVVFVSGLENVVSATVEPRSQPMLLILDIMRDKFARKLPRPIVFFVSSTVLQALFQGARAFFAARSGVYKFPSAGGYRDHVSLFPVERV